MGNNLKKFETKSDYSAYLNGYSVEYPHVAYIKETEEVIYNDDDLYPKVQFNVVSTPLVFSHLFDKIYIPRGTGTPYVVTDCFSGLNFNELHLPSNTNGIAANFCANSKAEWYLYLHRIDPCFIDANAFASCNNLPTKIYVPKRNSGKYKDATNWRQWAEIIDEMP